MDVVPNMPRSSRIVFFRSNPSGNRFNIDYIGLASDMNSFLDRSQCERRARNITLVSPTMTKECIPFCLQSPKVSNNYMST